MSPVTIPFEGSGEFVPVREWTCPLHDSPRDHYCDCEHCDLEWDCKACSISEWVETDEMRELSKFEVPLRDCQIHQLKTLSEMTTWFASHTTWFASHTFPSKVEWLEDEVMPDVTNRREQHDE